MKKIGIIGGGILGLSIAHALVLTKKYKVHLFEKENEIGQHQSGNNSGVLHCGLYYEPGSLKANLAVNGIREMISFCKKHKIDHDICGKLVVASNEYEVKSLENLAKRGELNGLKGLKFLNKSELNKREPNVLAFKSLLVPEEGIVDYRQVMNKLSEIIQECGGMIHLNSKIQKVINHNNSITVFSNENEINFDKIINCTGLFSDRTFNLITKKKRPLRIIPFRGEYMKIKSEYNDIINHLIYPVPDSKYPFLGVHFTRMIDGSREVGPNAVLAFKREGYSKSSFSLKDSFESLTYPGLLRFVRTNFIFSVNEFKSSLLMKDFIAKAQKMIPDVDVSMLERGSAGVRAQAISREGKLQMDFNIIRTGRQIHVLNAPSPGATASLAIASHIIENYLYKH